VDSGDKKHLCALIQGMDAEQLARMFGDAVIAKIIDGHASSCEACGNRVQPVLERLLEQAAEETRESAK
jgi:hypothetical protein